MTPNGKNMTDARPAAIDTSADIERRRLAIRTLVLIAISFFTLVDLFAAQAILPILADRFAVSAGAMGAAVNASTIGMAVAGVGVAVFSRRIPRRMGVCLSLIALALPTMLLAHVDSLTAFSGLRIAQGLLMSTAFTLMVAYLSEECAEFETAGALAAFITGNVASNLFGRIIAASLASSAGVEATFYVFAIMNMAGAVLVFFWLRGTEPRPGMLDRPKEILNAWRRLFVNGATRASFAIGFLILFIFVGAFTYINPHLAGPPFHLSTASLGLIYLVFLPSLISTPFTGGAVARLGIRRAFALSLGAAAFGLALTLWGQIALVLLGLALLGGGLFFAQAAVAAFVGKAAAADDKAMASALYLGFYYAGGLVGGVAIGALYGAYAWFGAGLGLLAALALTALLGLQLRLVNIAPKRSQET